MKHANSSPDKIIDIAIIGGGINGCGIARDAAGRGWSVALFEMGDLASATSQWSTKLIHGGLRYLEHYRFRLVREALIEREVLMRIAPHIIHPLRFILPHHKGLRPAWLLRLGLFIYDNLGGRKLLPGTTTLDLRQHETGRPLKAGYRKAFEYSDASVDDTRLVVLNAQSAKAFGAEIHVGQKVVSAIRLGGYWNITTRSLRGEISQTKARALINATGPWVADVITDVAKAPLPAGIRLVQGSHIIVKKLFSHDKAYIFQNTDQRIIFAIPYCGEFTLIGTTDQDYKGDPANVAITKDEISYLCASASEYFASEIKPDDVVWSYSGVRPLYDDGASAAQEATRDYVLKVDVAKDKSKDKTNSEHGNRNKGEAVLLSIFGGKITTYRRLAEEALEQLEPHLPKADNKQAGWTGLEPLPGGNFPVDGIADLITKMISVHPWLPQALASRLAHSYGTTSFTMIDGKTGMDGLGQQFGAGLTETELRHMVQHEWARTAQDVLWRRSKLGLLLTADEHAAVQNWLDQNVEAILEISAS